METKEIIEFISLAQASEYLGKNKGYLSNQLKKENYIVNNYRVFISEK